MSKTTPLHRAAREGDLATVRRLLRAGADIEARDESQNTALMLAAWFGHIDVARCLIGIGADVNAIDGQGWTPLHCAARYGFPEITALLVQNGADVKAVMDKGLTPLHLAAAQGFSEIAALLVQNGADVNVIKDGGWTPLHLAAAQGFPEIAALLVQNGADVTAVMDEGVTPLHCAARYGFPEIAALLVQNGANVNVVMDDGWTPLHLAALCGFPEIVEMLLRNGARLDLKNNDGDTPVHVAVKGGNITIIDELLKYGLHLFLDIQNYRGQIPLHITAMHESEEVIRKLLEAGSPVDVKDNGERTPLDYVPMESKDVRQLLRNAMQRMELEHVTHGRNVEQLADDLSGVHVTVQAESSVLQSSTTSQPVAHDQSQHEQQPAMAEHYPSLTSSDSDESSESTIEDSRRQLYEALETLKPGVVFGRTYTIKHAMGKGKPHLRYARQLYSKKANVVLKFYHDQALFENLKELHEQLAGSLHIYEVVEPMDTARTDYPPCLVLEMGQHTLSAWLQSGAPSVVDRNWWCLQQVLQGIKEAHSKGVVHSDIKPSNVMFFPEVVRWKLIDFDTARRSGKENVTGYTIPYAAPELLWAIRNNELPFVAQRSLDLWSVGVVAYEVVTGDRFFGEDATVASVTDDIANGRVEADLGRIEDVKLVEFLSNLLKVDPTERWTIDQALESDVFFSDECTTTTQSHF